mmetsp:Transcript_57017/g.121071  ORF Transcript_57017/g.121071 Transcript_57017/m.121071 type:complete len:150 (+) Transcript_57017:150-599(+)
MKLAHIPFLLLASAVAASTRNETAYDDMQHPCSARFMAVDAHCADDRSRMDECFTKCMAERGMLDDAIEMPSCPGLADTLCVCTKRCTSKLDDGCGDAMIATVECNLVNEFGCAGHTCPKSSFALSGKGLRSMRAAAAILRKSGARGGK